MTICGLAFFVRTLKNFGARRLQYFIARNFGFFFIIKIGQNQKFARIKAAMRQYLEF